MLTSGGVCTNGARTFPIAGSNIFDPRLVWPGSPPPHCREGISPEADRQRPRGALLDLAIVHVAADSPLTFGLGPSMIIREPQGIRSCNCTRRILWKRSSQQEMKLAARPQRSLRACTHGIS